MVGGARTWPALASRAKAPRGSPARSGGASRRPAAGRRGRMPRSPFCVRSPPSQWRRRRRLRGRGACPAVREGCAGSVAGFWAPWLSRSQGFAARGRSGRSRWSSCARRRSASALPCVPASFLSGFRRLPAAAGSPRDPAPQLHTRRPAHTRAGRGWVRGCVRSEPGPAGGRASRPHLGFRCCLCASALAPRPHGCCRPDTRH